MAKNAEEYYKEDEKINLRLIAIYAGDADYAEPDLVFKSIGSVIYDSEKVIQGKKEHWMMSLSVVWIKTPY